MIHDSASSRVRTHLVEVIKSCQPGDRLPSVRSLMSELGVSPTTIRQAVNELVRSGQVETISGSGTFVSVPRTASQTRGDLSWQTVALGSSSSNEDLLSQLRSSVHGDTIDLASGYPDSSLHPGPLITRALADAARRPGSFGRSPIEGIGPLREWFAEQVGPARIHEILITPGGQSALFLAFRSLAMPGDAVIMETPTYVGAIAAARAAGLNPVPTPMDGDGVLIDSLEASIESSGARLIYLQPLYHNPTGACLYAGRKEALLELAERKSLIIIEDEWLRDLAQPGTSPSLASQDINGHVVNIRSLTKSVAPAFRIGSIAAAGPVFRRIRSARSVEDIFVSTILQEAALSIVTGSAWSRHLKWLRSELNARQQVLRDELDGMGWLERASGGPLHVWVELPPHLEPDTFAAEALRRGVSIISGNQWHPGDATANNIRLSNASASREEIIEGMTRLRKAADQ